MSKNPLLPKEYSDSGTQSAIVYALSPYKINDRADIVNPHLKWNLQQAWQDSQDLLSKAQWKPRSALEEEFVISADTDQEVDSLNAMIAGIVAYQIMEEDAGVNLRRIEHHKGGEMTLVISGEARIKLRRLLPDNSGEGDSGAGKKRWWSMLSWKKKIKHGSNE